jgi:signal transduction histidine kinase
MSFPEPLFNNERGLDSPLSYGDILLAIVESTANSIQAKGCSLLLLTKDRKQLIHSASYGLSKQYIEKGPLLSSKSLTKAIEGESILALHADKDRNIQYRKQAKKEGIASILSLPVTIKEEVIGVMRIYTSEPRQFTDEEIHLLEGTASLGALALLKTEMHEAASSDLQQCNIDLSRLEYQRQQLFYFSSMAAHDLKAPLSAVQTYFSVILGGFAGEVGEKQKTILQRCHIRVSELLGLISDLLDIPRIEAGRILTEIEQVNLRKIVNKSMDVARTLCKQKNITISLDLPRRCPVIYASGTRLEQILTHLLSNAISYTNPGGQIKFKVINGRRAVQFEVSDTGIGIPSDELKQIFADFVRGSSNVEVKGTGLGLSIAKRVVEAHNGLIWAESPCLETGKGSRFIFTIPKNLR